MEEEGRLHCCIGCQDADSGARMYLTGVVSGLLGALYSICCLGVSTIFDVTMWHTNDLIPLTRKGSRGVGAQPPLLNKQNVKN